MKKQVMKKGIILVLLSVIVAIAFAFAACSAEHVHTYSKEWTSDSFYHWHSADCEHENEIADKAEHNWDSGKVTVAATCDTQGVKTYTCKDCGETKNESIEKTAHTYLDEWSYDTYYHWHAAACGHNNEVADRAEHNWNNGEITVAATCNTQGIKTYTCKDCGKTKNESIEKTAHTYSDEWSYDTYYHWHAATCGHNNIVIDRYEHKWDDGKVTIEATELKEGLVTFTCADCAKTYTEVIPVIEYGNENDFTYLKNVDGTYTVTGLVAENKKQIIIPSAYKGQPVTAISDYAFFGSEFISVKLPASITSIGAHAFEKNVNLNELYLDNELQNIITFKEWTSEIGGLEIGKYAFADTGFMSVSISDSTDGDTNVDLTVLNKYSNIAKLSVSAALNTTTDIIFTDSVLFTRNETNVTTSVNFGTYGLFKSITIKAIDYNGEEVAAICGGDVAVTAAHYNLALMNGSYPVLVFSLKLSEISSTGPTFVALERCDAYDWNNLPENVQYMPFATKYDATQNKSFHHLRDGIANYINELYSLNRNSTFTFYAVDNYPELILQMLVANQIPESQWNAVLLSDGVGTAGILSSTFGIDNPAQKFVKMAENWQNIKSYVYANGYDSAEIASKTEFVYSSDKFSILARYPYVITKVQSNVEWWTNRLNVNENISAINVQDSKFATDIISTAKVLYTNNLLAALSAEQTESFKALYHFSDEMFSVAEEQNKEVVIILGTSWSGENGNLYGYIKTLIDMYGTDDYVYYYKGHPGYPTSQYVGRQEYFDKLAEDGYTIYELDNAIAAEIILFFNPDIYMAGYSTSTFDSVESQDKALVLFGPKSKFSTATYKEYFDIFVSILTDASDYEGVELVSDHEYFLIEYNNTESYANQMENYLKHEIAVYDATVKQMKYYKLTDGIFLEVDEEGNIA